MDVKNDFAYVLQFFLLISDGLGSVNGLKMDPGLSNIIDYIPACSAVYGCRSYKVTDWPVAAELGLFQLRIPAIAASHSFRRSSFNLRDMICDLFKGEAAWKHK